MLNSKPLSRQASQTNCGSSNLESQATEVMAFECSIIMKKSGSTWSKFAAMLRTVKELGARETASSRNT